MMSYTITKKEIELINEDFLQCLKFNENSSQSGILIYSKLIKIENGTFYLDVFISKGWGKTPIETVNFFINTWLYRIKELKKCTHYKINIFYGKTLGFQLLTLANLKRFFNHMARNVTPSDYTLVYTQTNTNTTLKSIERLEAKLVHPD